MRQRQRVDHGPPGKPHHATVAISWTHVIISMTTIFGSDFFKVGRWVALFPLHFETRDFWEFPVMLWKCSVFFRPNHPRVNCLRCEYIQSLEFCLLEGVMQTQLYSTEG